MIEARTMAEADLAAEEACGPGWRTVYVQRVTKGGVAGFFATEVIELVASPAARSLTAPAHAEDLLSALGRDGGDFADRLLIELRALDAHPAPAAAHVAVPQPARNEYAAPPARPVVYVAPPIPPPAFARTMRSDAAPAPLAHVGEFEREFTPPETVPTPRATAVALASAPLPGRVPETERLPQPEPTVERVVRSAPVRPAVASVASSTWSQSALMVLGLPESLIDGVLAAEPMDDEEWTAALMLALRDLVGPAPHGPVVIIGPHAAEVAGLRRANVMGIEALATTDGTVAVVTQDAAALADAANGRTFHLVVGGAWSTLAGLRPSAVTASSIGDLPAALRIAAAWSVKVSAVRTSERLEPADAVGVAVAIRSLLVGSVGLARSPGVADTHIGARPAP
jgi:hypothetical protein